MERLTKRKIVEGQNLAYISDENCFYVWSIPKTFLGNAIERLAAIEDILGDEYDLDRLETIMSQRITLRKEVAEKMKLVGNISVDNLREIIDFENKKGDTVWVIERDEDGEAVDFSGFVFITSVCGVAIVSPTLNESDDVDYILQDQIEQTASNFNGDLAVYPISDCYWSRESAEAAMKGEHNETN